MLVELLKSIGLDVNLHGNASLSPPAACKKCARKIVNCSTLFHKLEVYCESQDRKQFTIWKTVTWKSFSTPDPKRAKDIPQEPQQQE